MRKNWGATGRWRFSAGVLAPAVAALLATLALVVGFMVWASNGVDERSLSREIRMVAHIFDQELERLPHEQESVAIWDEALMGTRGELDLDWLDINLGVWMHDYFGHHRVYILDDRNRPIYAMIGGARVDPTAYRPASAAIAPLVALLRTRIASGALERYEAGEGPYPNAVDLVRVDGVPAIISVVPITSDSGLIPQERGTEPLHVSVVELDAAYARTLADEYMLDGASFSSVAGAEPGDYSYPVFNEGRRLISYFDWTPARPGQQLLQQTIPVIGGAFFIAMVLVLALANGLYRSSRDLEAGRRSAAHQATHDALTGLANRTRFESDLAQALAEPRAPDESLALMMLDLDRFKHVNDTLGHSAGDELIRAVGQRLQELVGPGDKLARLGGDEFAVIHRTRGGIRDAQALAHRIIEAVGKPFDIAGREAFVGVSLGLVLAGDEETDRLELARKGDIALYEAKATGRNRAALYRDEMNDLVQNRHAIESELRKALKRNDQLSVVFQPLFSRETGRIIGAEALARWHHPHLGQVSPVHFIPVAEAAGLIESLGNLVLRRTAELGARWPGLRMAVNLSPTQLRNPGFASQLFALLRETGMRSRDLELEITEGVLIDDDQATVAAIEALRSQGVRIALDDFGTGYSSLNYLKRYPVDCIKVDRSFVSQLSKGSVSAAIVQAMITLAHAMGIEVTAEGVETHEQMNMLAEMGCNTFQGFLLSTPVTPLMIDGLFRSHGEGAGPGDGKRKAVA